MKPTCYRIFLLLCFEVSNSQHKKSWGYVTKVAFNSAAAAVTNGSLAQCSQDVGITFEALSSTCGMFQENVILEEALLVILDLVFPSSLGDAFAIVLVALI